MKSLWQSPAFAPSPELWILQLLFLFPCFPASKMGERSSLRFVGKQRGYIFVTRLSNSVKSSMAKQLRTWLILLLQLGSSHVQRGQPGSTQCMPRLPSIIHQLRRVRAAPSRPWPRLGHTLQRKQERGHPTAESLLRHKVQEEGKLLHLP